MVTKEDLKIVVDGYTFPSPLRDTYSVKKVKQVGFAEHTAKSMRIDTLGDIWEVKFTLPPQTKDVYKAINQALEPYVVEVSFYNEILQERMTTTFFSSDLEVSRVSQQLTGNIELLFTGTEIM